jgi:hypothetical protein
MSMTQSGIERRQRVRTPYHSPAKLGIVGQTGRDEDWPVVTFDASPWGVGIRSSRPLPTARVAVVIELPAPADGTPLRVLGVVAHGRELPDPAGTWEGGIEFDAPEPQLAAPLIERAAYRT